IAHAEKRGMNAHLDFIDGFRIEVMLGANLLRRINRRVREIAGGVVLEERLANQEASLESIERFTRWFCAGVRGGESLRGLDDFGIGSVAAARGECAEQSIGCGAPRMQRLRHRSETRLEPSSLRTRQPPCAPPSI